MTKPKSPYKNPAVVTLANETLCVLRLLEMAIDDDSGVIDLSKWGYEPSGTREALKALADGHMEIVRAWSDASPERLRSVLGVHARDFERGSRRSREQFMKEFELASSIGIFHYEQGLSLAEAKNKAAVENQWSEEDRRIEQVWMDWKDFIDLELSVGSHLLKSREAE